MVHFAQIRFCLGDFSKYYILISDNRLKTVSANFFRLSKLTSFSGGRGVRPSFSKKFPFFFLVIYLDRRSEGGGSAVPWYIIIYISLYTLSQYLSIYIDLFLQSIFFLSICLSIYFFLFIYLQRGGAAVPWYMIIYI